MVCIENPDPGDIRQIPTDTSAPESQSLFHSTNSSRKYVKSQPGRDQTAVTMKSNPDLDPGNNRKIPTDTSAPEAQSISHDIGTIRK